MKSNYILVISLVILFVIGGFTIFGIHTTSYNSTDFGSSFKIIKANMESPSLIIDVNSTTTLVNKANQLNITTLYDTSRGFVVLDTVNSIAYLLSSTTTWYGMDAMLGGAFLIGCGIIITVGLVVALYRYGDDD
jgi:hypothetical protein